MAAKKQDGSSWSGWALLCGIPATITGFAIGGPLGLVTLAATMGALKRGSDLDKQFRDDQELEQLRDLAQRKKIARDAELPALRDAWEIELAQLNSLYEEGDIDGDEYEAAMDELIDRWPR